MVEEIKITEGEFISKTLFHLNNIKGFHWQTKSYAEHKVLDEYHCKLTELIDKFTESFDEFKPSTDAGCIDVYIDKADVIQHVNEYHEKVKDIRATINYAIIDNNEEYKFLLSLIDDIEQLINQTTYHLRFK
tara:strand:- start:433 stop:828 length:396 start_codon:yes stop_codon:yes gene_type:complete